MLGWKNEAGDDFHQSGFAGSIRAEKCHDAFVDIQRDIVEGELFAILFGDMIDLNSHLRKFWCKGKGFA